MAANKRFILAILILAAFTPLIARAAMGLLFKNDASERQKILIQNYLGKPLADLAIAKADLNDDEIEELIVRSDCKNSLCDFRVLAELHGKLVELADIQAQNIQLSDTFTNGVRNIIAFKNASNDFDHSVYIWEPQARRYMIEK